jgi:tetratricopeptide (TPR) repeat protein
MARRLAPIALCLATAACATWSTQHFELGKERYEKRDYPQAIEQFTLELKRDPHNADAHHLRGMCRLLMIESDGFVTDARIRSALADLDRAIELSPDSYSYYYTRAMAHAVMARYRDAVSDLLVCIQSKDRELAPKAHRRLAQIYDDKFEGMQDLALRHYEVYLQMGGDDSTAARRCAALKKTEDERSDVGGGHEALVKARRLADSSEHGLAVELLAKLLSESGLPEDVQREARELYVKERLALEIDRKAQTLFDTATEMLQAGKRAGAVDLLDELVRKYPDTSVARTKAVPLLKELRNREN